MVDAIVYDYGYLLYKPTFMYVEELPNVGRPVVDLNSDNDDFCFYYNSSNGLVYCYVDEALSAATNLQSGWYDYQEFLYIFGDPNFGIIILAVNNLPNSGMPSLMFDQNEIPYGDVWGYYSQSDNEAYCYVDDNLSAFIYNQLGQSIPKGWYLLAQLAPMNDIYYQGIFTKEEDIPSEGVSILLTNTLYSYNNQWEPIQTKQEFVQPNWDQSDDTQPDYIWNKPIDDNGKIKTEYLYQPDWNVYDKSSPYAIKNRPFGDIPSGTVLYDGYRSFVTLGEEEGIRANIGYLPLNSSNYYKVQWDEEDLGLFRAERLDNSLVMFNEFLTIRSQGSNTYVTHTTASAGVHRITIIAQNASWQCIDKKYLPFTIENQIVESSTNPISSGAVYAEISSISASINSLKECIKLSYVTANDISSIFKGGAN